MFFSDVLIEINEVVHLYTPELVYMPDEQSCTHKNRCTSEISMF